jgi:hypothetical protein
VTEQRGFDGSSVAPEHRFVKVAPDDTGGSGRSREEERGAGPTVLQPITGELPLFVRDECPVAVDDTVDDVVDLDADRGNGVRARVRPSYEFQHGGAIQRLTQRGHHREVRMEDRGEAGKLGVAVLEGSVEPSHEERVQADDLDSGARGDVDPVTLRQQVYDKYTRTY